MAEQSPLDYHITTLTAHVGELNDNHANLTAIADWCAATYATPGDNHPETIARTKEYLKDALVTITQQVTSSGQAFTACLDQQTLELQHIAATMRLVENRLSSQKEHIARSAMLSQFWRKQPIPRTDAESVIEAEPDRYKPTRTARCTIDFGALDAVGRGPALPQQGRGAAGARRVPPAPPDDDDDAFPASQPPQRLPKSKPPPPPPDEEDDPQPMTRAAAPARKPPPPPPDDEDDPYGDSRPMPRAFVRKPPPPPPDDDEEGFGDARTYVSADL